MNSHEVNETRGVTPEALSKVYPRLYHMTHEGGWDQIQRYGLLSTTALLNVWQVKAERRRRIESEARKSPVVLLHPQHGKVVIRDQKPLEEKKLRKALVDCTPQEWCRLLNRKVFFWPTWERLRTHMSARGNRGKKHLVLTLDTYLLVTAYKHKITLCPLNSGNTIPFAHKRGRHSFMPMDQYPFNQRVARGRYYTVVELAVDTAIPDVFDFVVSADYMRFEGCSLQHIEDVKARGVNDVTLRERSITWTPKSAA
jgi:hypothetical protein